MWIRHMRWHRRCVDQCGDYIVGLICDPQAIKGAMSQPAEQRSKDSERIIEMIKENFNERGDLATMEDIVVPAIKVTTCARE